MTPESGHNTIKDGPEFERRKALVRQKIDIWKKHLLDLTRRNRLLFFTASRTNTVRIISPAPQELFEQLVVHGRQLSFPTPRRDRQLDLENINDPNSESVLYEGSKAGDLETSSPVRDLQTKLYRLRRELRTWQEEQGVHTLFLALGMLHWREAEYEQEECLAPLVLVPVGLEKEGTDKPYAIECVEEDIVINPALAYKLEIDQGMDLPELAEEPQWSQVEQFLNNVAKQVKPMGWHLTIEAWLGRFSFEKFVMYRDLEELKEAAVSHPIVGALAGASSLPPPAHLPGIDDMDTLIDPKEVFPVLDADSSQLEVLIRARSEQNLVVQGPPGTGKSQTIVNLITQGLKDAKKILFVSEKMAALEVVFRRLKEVGLSFACLEVHSHHSNKAKVIEELGRTLQQSSAGRVPMDAADRFNRLVRRRELLNQYVKELHKPRGALSRTAYNVHGQLAKYSNEPDVNFKLPLERAEQATSENLDNWCTAILGVAAIPEVWNNYSYHPWLGADIDPKTYTIEQRDALVLAVKEVRGHIGRIETLTKLTANKLGLKEPLSLEDCQRFLEILDVLNACVPVAEIWLQLTLPNLENYLSLAREAEKHAGRLAEGFDRLRTIFKEGILELPVDAILGRFQGKYRSALRWTKREYWQDLKLLKEYWVGPRRIKFQAVLEGLEVASLVISERGWFTDNGPSNTRAFADFYKGPGSDWGVIISGLEWVYLLKKHLPKGEIPTQLSTLALDPTVLQATVRQPLSDFGAIIASFDKYYQHLEKIYRSYRIQGHEISKAPFDILKPWFDSKVDPKDLDDWVSFLRARNSCDALGLSGFLEAALSDEIKANQLETVFLRRFWKIWIAEAHRDSPPLNEFRKQRHEEIIGEFRALDRELKKIAAALVQEEIQKRQPKREEARVKESQVGILLREMQKKKRHRPLRKLFAEIPDLLQALKPCLLMSPLSVAAYLGPSTCRFDVVIFDEASQIPPEDAIGAILRGSQLIVAGDSKQLPPTKFFQVDIDPDEDEDAVDQAPLESILDECQALPVGFQPAPLTWHYRSRYEELIAFSNRQFYRSSLVTFPSPQISALRTVQLLNWI